MEKCSELYRGKAKTVYATDDPNLVIIHYRDDVTAFNKLKTAELSGKGQINNQFSTAIMQYLMNSGIATHFVKKISANESLCKKVAIIPLECVVRNYAAGSLCKRLPLVEGEELKHTLIEFYYKDDERGDPLLTEDHIHLLQLATDYELQVIKQQCLTINQILTKLFADAGLLLVDYKLEFGRYQDEILLADEITPDGCRIWDKMTKEKLDKDRFRLDLGDVLSGYLDVARRLKIEIVP